jgi:hypothetical protein
MYLLFLTLKGLSQAMVRHFLALVNRFRPEEVAASFFSFCRIIGQLTPPVMSYG